MGFLAVEVHHVRERSGAGIVDEIARAVEKELVGVVACPPGVQRVDGRKTRLQPRGDAPEGLLRRPGEGNTEVGRDVDQVRPLAAGVEYRGEPPGHRSPPRAQELRRSAISFSVPTRA